MAIDFGEFFRITIYIEIWLEGLLVVSVPPSEINVLVVDDVELVAETIATGLKFSFGYKVHTSSCIFDALKKVDQNGSYSAVLLDFKMPGTDPYEAIRKLSCQNRGRTAIFSGISDIEAIAKAKDAGAVAFIPKDTPIAKIGSIIGHIAAGSIEVSSGTPGKPGAPRPGAETVLKKREQQTLALLADGHDIAAVSAALGVAAVIVSIDVRSICQKLELSNIEEALEKARTLGLV